MSLDASHSPYRYVAIGDSSTEGLDDPDGQGGYRGWANRLADHLAEAHGQVLYANHAVRGLQTQQILEQQVGLAVEMAPNLVTIFAGTNDVIRLSFDLDRVAASMETIQATLIRAGATVLTFTLPDLTPIMPLVRPVAPRVHQLNDAIRKVSAETGATLVDFAAYPTGSDPRFWSRDRLHANSLGHARVAAALAEALELPGTDHSWSNPLPPESRSFGQRLRAELAWGHEYLRPWIWRHLRGKSSGDGRVAKQPEFRLIETPGRPDAGSATAPSSESDSATTSAFHDPELQTGRQR